MEISGKLPPLEKTLYTHAAPAKVDQPVVTPGPQGDRVELSPRARELQAAHEAVAQMDEMDLEKVARVKAQIKAGTYEIDALKIADKMIDEALLGDL